MKRQAKAEGLPVTADVSINSLHLTDVDIGYFNADMRLTPPLRQGADRDALRAGLADGTIELSPATPDAAVAAGLADEVCEPESLMSTGLQRAAEFTAIPGGTFELLKVPDDRWLIMCDISIRRPCGFCEAE